MITRGNRVYENAISRIPRDIKALVNVFVPMVFLKAHPPQVYDL
jgi:hypothetical protein